MEFGDFTGWVARLAYSDDFEKNRHEVLKLRQDQWEFYVLLLKLGNPILDSIEYMRQMEALEIAHALTREELLEELLKIGPLSKSIKYVNDLAEAGSRGYKAGSALRNILLNQINEGLTKQQIYEQLQRELASGR